MKIVHSLKLFLGAHWLTAYTCPASRMEGKRREASSELVSLIYTYSLWLIFRQNLQGKVKPKDTQ